MAEALSPNARQRPPFTSPTKSPFFIGSNDDKLERAQARAARAAAIRRKNMANTSTSFSSADSLMEKGQILELFHNCIKLASENKINQKNTWELNLIDHLYELVKVEEETDAETNFQKANAANPLKDARFVVGKGDRVSGLCMTFASCTLEAGVKIYSTRVDSVHSEAYKVLGGINRVGQEDAQDRTSNDDNVNNEEEEGKAHKDQQKKLSPLTTLESSFAAINVKKFDAAFVVDPLYHQTSALFDEGGAKGLLLNNLGVYGNCRVIFDSLEVPGKCVPSMSRCDATETIDLSFAKECIEEMVLGMVNSTEISPTLSVIVDLFDKDNRRPSGEYASAPVDETPEDNIEFDNTGFGFDHDDQGSVVDESNYDQDTSYPTQQEFSDIADEQFGFQRSDEGDGPGEVDDYLFLNLGFSRKQNAWAGPSHWKYQKAKEPDNPTTDNGSPKTKKPRNKKTEVDIDFVSAVDTDLSHIFAAPKNPRSLLLPANKVPCNTKLPEDCHYQPEDLVKLFLLPNVLCLGRSGRKRTDEATEHMDGYGENASWGDVDDGFGEVLDDGNAQSDGEEPSVTLVSQPRQVNKIEVQYDRTSKQVDVHALKGTLWDHMQKLHQVSLQEEEVEESISFKQALLSFPEGCKAAPVSDISPHLCFICLLHLANEHGLLIKGQPDLDDLSIHFISS